MQRAQYFLERLSELFVEKRCVLKRRKGDTEVHAAATNGHTAQPLLNGALRVCRWVQQDGKTVRFSQGIGPFQGRIHVHYLPSLMVAHAFAVALLRTDSEGYPAPLDPEEWAAWQEEFERI